MNTFAARNYKFGPGDIVVYVSPKDPTDCLIKRVIGLEGDIISSNRYVITTLYTNILLYCPNVDDVNIHTLGKGGNNLGRQ